MIEDVRELTGIPPLTCMKAMADYFMVRTLPPGLSRWAVVLAPGAEGLHEAVRIAEVFSIGGPVEVRGFDDMSLASAWVSPQRQYHPATAAVRQRPSI